MVFKLPGKKSGIGKALSLFNKPEKNIAAKKVIAFLNRDSSVIFYPMDLNILNDGLLNSILKKFQDLPALAPLMDMLQHKNPMLRPGSKPRR